MSRDGFHKRARKHLQVFCKENMAHLEFCIPVTGRDELVQSTKKRGQYAVRRVLSDPSEIQQKVEGRLS